MRPVALLLACIFSIPAWAGVDSVSEALRQASACPAVFGGERDHHNNRRLRNRSLERLEQNKHLLSVTHSTHWRHPERLRLKGITLRRVDRNLAVLEIREVDGCEPGFYALRVDHSFGQNGRVLAFQKNLVLVELRGDLRYLKTLGAPDPSFRMIWRSHWSLNGLERGGPRISHTPSQHHPGMPPHHITTPVEGKPPPQQDY